MLRTHWAGKGPGGWGVGLRLNAAGGAQECLRPWRAEGQVWDPSRLSGPEWAGEMLGAFSPPTNPLILEGPYPLASLLPPPPSYAPRTSVAWRWPWRAEDPAREPSRLPGANWAGQTLGTLPPPQHPSLCRSLQAWAPLPSPSHPSGAPVLSSLHFSSPLTAPHILPSCSGVPPIFLGIEVPHHSVAAALGCGET